MRSGNSKPTKRNPSAWPRRIAIAVVSAIGFLIATYLALFQVGLTQSVWDPFFGHGSELVVTSSVSRSLPVPDAAIGAAVYLADAILALVGGTRRYRTEPILPLLMGLAVAASVLVSIVLIILQPTVVHAWCTLCLTSAVISFVLGGLAWDEAEASFWVLRDRSGRGR